MQQQRQRQEKRRKRQERLDEQLRRLDEWQRKTEERERKREEPRERQRRRRERLDGALAGLLQGLERLTSLDLGDVEAGEKGWDSLAAAMPALTALTELNLSCVAQHTQLPALLAPTHPPTPPPCIKLSPSPAVITVTCHAARKGLVNSLYW